jgi:hypothetical protein
LEEADAEFAARIGDVFAMGVVEFDGVPELFDVRVGVIASDVVKDDEATGADQRRVHFPISCYAGVGVIAIEEQQVDGAAGEEAFGFIQRGRCMRIGAEEVELLMITCEAAIDGDAEGRVAATEFATGEIDADERGVGLSQVRPEIQGAAAMRADFDDGLSMESFYVVEELREFVDHLNGGKKHVTIVEGGGDEIVRAAHEGSGKTIKAGQVFVGFDVEKKASETHAGGEPPES